MSDERERERLRNINRLRLNWHERLIADPELHKGAAPLAFAGLVLHRFHAVLGYAEVSVGYASVKLRMPKATIHRGRRLLLSRNWIVPRSDPAMKLRRRPDLPKRYTLGGGPEDLILEELRSATDDTGVTDDIPE
jgi:hypothetical protein